MSKITDDDIIKLAKLSRLSLDKEEIPKFRKELQSILSYVEMLDSVDVSGYEPTSQVTGLKNVTRPDQEIDYGPSPQDLLKGAPSSQYNMFKVPRMIV
jgi:aspartyl-tRNA(Asn)/glutamyl-tRNA(Gln) amidotransferase subunit C